VLGHFRMLGAAYAEVPLSYQIQQEGSIHINEAVVVSEEANESTRL
jgi:hypothetical protein